MTVTWILVANRAQARLFESAGRGKELQPVREIEHPEGRLATHELGSDRPGRTHDSLGQGRHAMGKEHDAAEQTAIRFAKQLSVLLEEGRTQSRFTKLVLIAEPRFLGHLRSALSRETAATVVASLDKDLPGIDAKELSHHLAGI